jgi:plasmid stabilization system protein ParE
MDYQIVWAPRAAENLEHNCNYIAHGSEYYAALVAKRILETVESISAMPFMGRVVPEFDDENIRERIYKHYRIIYRIAGHTIEIAAIQHGAQLLDPLE